MTEHLFQPASSSADVDAALIARGPGRMIPNMERISALLDLLGKPQTAYPAIHLTGTNGKTSTTRMIDALLRAHGLRVGRYTSPHLASARERIAIDGAPLPEDRYVEVFNEVEERAALVDASGSTADTVTYFEMLTAMAFAAFADAPVDVAVVEVGMGGAWDATNVLSAPVVVVTPVSKDHEDFLGEGLGAIATEKAGIIHDNTTLVMALQNPEVADVLLRRAVQVGATVAREGLEFGVVERELAVGGQLLQLQGLGGTYDEIFLPLFGGHQAQNANLALAATEAFLGAGAGAGDAEGEGADDAPASNGAASRALSIDLVREGFAQVTSPGRLEILRTSPTVVGDAAHNPIGLAATLAAVMESFAFRRLVMVFAALSDKDARAMLEQAEPVVDNIVITTNSSPRTIPLDDLEALTVDVFGTQRVEVRSQLSDALDVAVELAEETTALTGAGILVTGSVVTVADARRLVGR